MAKIMTSDFQKGMFIEYRGQPHQIVEFQFVNPGKGSAFVRTKLKNVKSGRVYEFTYKSGESAKEIPVNVREMQYLYKADEQFVFMDRFTYEQLTLGKDIIGTFSSFLKESEIYQIYVYENQAIGMRYPQKVKLKVTASEDAVKGNSVTGAKKMVTVETGAQIAVPLFIKEGDTISIDPATGAYVERLSQE